MPLPFSNVWDSSQPPDTALVSQGAAEFRKLRTDIQQRMAAISGIDAAKPNFNADTQVNNWLGILYFATDTGKIYQFNPPTAWVDVTANFITGGGGGGGGSAGVLDKNTISTTLTNSTGETTIFTTNVPALGSTAILRVRMNFVVDTWAASFNVIWRWNGGVILSAGYPSGVGGTTMGTELFIANRTVTNAQQWNWYSITAPSGQIQGGSSGAAVGETNLNTSVGTVLTCSVLDSAAGNRQTFNLWLVESL